jgi:hypothetical protein
MPNLDLYAQTTRKLAAQRQIDAAIAHLHKAELECAITLAAAAEGMLPDTEEPHIFGYLRRHPSFKEANFNETINWLKHNSGSDANVIYEFDAAVTIARAMSKWGAVYGANRADACLLSGVKRTSLKCERMSPFDPKQTCSLVPVGFGFLR